MKILLTNDDGYDAPGIQVFYNILKQAGHDVLLVAPDREKSAVGHGISLNTPLRIKKIKLHEDAVGYAVNGTPADCIKLALYELFDTPPDMAIAGINPGSNTGVNINYSGTASAAREASLNQVPGIAVSSEVTHDHSPDYTGISRFIVSLISRAIPDELPELSFLNINVPALPVSRAKGILITRQSDHNVSETFEKRKDPKDRTYFWYGPANQPEGNPGSDIYALSHQYISISPIQCNTTVSTGSSKLEHLEDINLFNL